MKNIVIYGAGGLALEVENIINRLNLYNKANNVDSLYNLLGFITTGGDKSEHGVIGGEEILNNKGISVVIGIGSPKVRFDIGSRLCENIGYERMPSIVDPSASFDTSSCIIMPGVVIAQNVVGTVNILFDRFSYINLSCTIGHGAKIGAGTVINPGANISGDVILGKRVLVGTGAKVLEKRSVCQDVIIGAGAVVVKNIIKPVTVVGVPAKALCGDKNAK